MTNDPSTKAFGVVTASTTYYAKGSAPANPVVDGDCTFTLTNDGSGAEKISIHGHSFTGEVGWTLTSGAPGVDTIKIIAYPSGIDPATGVVLTTADQTLIASMNVGHTHWDFSLQTGTFSDGVAKSGVITLTAAAP